MALIERLMHDNSETDDRWIAVHTFFAAASEVERGALTVNQVKSYYEMTTEDEDDFDALITLVTGTAINRLGFIQRIHCVFLLAEAGAPGYDTPANVRSKLGI